MITAHPALHELERLPFPLQLQHIEAWLDQGRPMEPLLRTLGGFPDHEPLAFALRALARRDALTQELAPLLTQLLAQLPDTGVQRILKGVDRERPQDAALAMLAQAAGQALLARPLEDLPAICLMDRWLKNSAPALRHNLQRAALERCQQALRGDALDTLEDRALVLIPGQRWAELEELAQELGRAQAWRRRLEDFTARVMEVLQRKPRSLSQANAEEILSRRVYTDPGHFLVELLQNAEDSGATAFEIYLEEQQAVIWHNGAPFDARDVVGVLSIGQTTKGKEQIGFFGVGFKSVYEVCERPQIHSSPFSFEIADISLPRPLASRPEGPWPQGGTLLVLPWRQGLGEARSPQRLYQRALEVPPETLLTLQHLRRFKVALGSQASRTAARLPHPDPSRARLRLEESGQERTWLTARRRFTRDDPARELSRGESTTALIAIALDPDGLPQPLPPRAPTVFSHLPTAEHSGLRFLIHAHFDLPVDRERLHLNSPWNLWVLDRLGDLLAELVADLCAQGQAATLEALLQVLPLPQELNHPAYQRLLAPLLQRAHALPLLRGHGDARLPPPQARLVEQAALVEALEDAPLDPAQGRAVYLEDPRARALALHLGAQAWDAPALLGSLEWHLASHRVGEPWPQGWLQRHHEALLLYLGQHQERLSAQRLRQLALWPDQDQEPARPGDLWRAAAPLRSLYGPARRFLHPALEQQPALRALAQAVGMPSLTPERAIEDLRDPQTAPLVLRHAGAPALLDWLAQQALALLRPLLDAPLFPDTQGRLRPLRGPEALLLPPGSPLAPWLYTMEGRRPPLLDAEQAHLHSGWLHQLGAQRLELEAALDALRQGVLEPDGRDLEGLHRALAQMAQDLTARHCAALAQAPLFLDLHGQRRSLRGPERAALPADPQIEALAPDAPWLHPSQRPLEHLPHLNPEVQGPSQVAQALAQPEQAGWLQGRLELRRCYPYLRERAAQLDPAMRQALALAPIWYSAEQEPLPLAQLRGQATDPRLEALHQALGLSPCVHPEAAALAGALALEDQLQPSTSEALCRALAEERGSALIQSELRPLLWEVLLEAAATLPASALAPLRQASLARDTQGRWLPPGDWRQPAQERAHRARASVRQALLPGQRPLMDPAQQEALAPLWDALHLEAAGYAELLRALEEDPGLDDEAARALARQALAEDPRALEAWLRRQPEQREALLAARLWPDLGGQARSAAQVVLSDHLQRAWGQDWRQVLGEPSQTSLLHPDAEPQARALAHLLPFQTPLRLVLELLRHQARPGQPLEQQPAALSSQPRLLRLTAWVLQHSDLETVQALPLALDHQYTLRLGPLCLASAQERLLVEGLPLSQALAHPDWALAARQIHPALAPSLDPSTLLRQLLEEVRATEGRCLEDPQRRQALYAWLLEQRRWLERDEAARGALGKAPWIPTQAKGWRPPRELLWLAWELPSDLGLDDWRCHPELPPELQQLLGQLYGAEGQQGRKHLAQTLVEAHKQAQSQEDAARSALIWETLGELLRHHDEGELERQAQSLKLHKLRVHSDQGGFEKVSKLLAAPPQARQLLHEFMDPPPACVSDTYQTQGARRLLRAAGARDNLSAEQLRRLLQDQEAIKPGLEASLALARYLALTALGGDSTGHRLPLEDLAWVPDGHGQRRRPQDLHWPDPDTEELLGPSPALYPHPSFFRTVPASVRASLPFRAVEDAQLSDVLAHLLGSSPPRPLSLTGLAWLEARLRDQAIDAEALRLALHEQPVLVDDLGRPCAPARAICRDASPWLGDRLQVWSDGLRHSKLASALHIPTQVGLAQIAALAAELHDALRGADPQRLLQREPALWERLPRCLHLLAQRGASPPPELPLAARRAGQATLCSLRDPALVLPAPGWMRPLLAQATDKLCVIHLEEEDQRATLQMLRQARVADLLRLWHCQRMDTGADLTLAHADALRQLQPKLDHLWKYTPALAQMSPAPPAPRVVEEITLQGTLGGEPATWRPPAAWHQGQLCLTPSALHAPEPLLRALLQATPALHAAPEEWAELLRATWDGRDTSQEQQSLAQEPARPAPPRPQPAPAPQEPGSPPHAERPQGSWWSKVKDWWQRDADPEADSGERDKPPQAPPARRADKAAPPAPKPFQPQDHSRWFTPRQAIHSQLEGATSWVQDRLRAPEYGLAHAPASLPRPWRYAVATLAGDFDRGTQRWLERSPLDPAWLRPQGEILGEASLRGRLPGGECLFPTPLFGELIELRASGVRQYRTRGGQTLLLVDAPTEVTCRVTLRASPQVLEGPPHGWSAPAPLLRPTAPEQELPEEALALIEDLLGRQDPWPARVQAIERFVQQRYIYDPSYLEDEAVARWLRRVSRGSAHQHLAALHAGADGRHLGRGVCHELGALVCELLRRAGIPAAVASGWTWDRGQLAEPDHLWAMALLPTAQGPRWLPVDASTTDRGRPLHTHARPPGPWTAPQAGSAPPPPPQTTRPRPSSGPGHAPPSEAARASRVHSARPPVAELMRVARHLRKLEPGQALPEDLHARCAALLRDPETARALLELLRGEKP